MTRARKEYAQIIDAIVPHERVVVVCRAEDGDTVRRLVSNSVEIVAHQVDDGWIRDNGPLAVRVDNTLVAVDFGFNSWGGRFGPWEGDSTVGPTLAAHFGVQREVVPFVLEGGAISFNGNGTAVVVEECVLKANRNGDVSRGRFESLVRARLGVRKVIWLPFGLLEDLGNTDGHVDNVAIFVAENRLLVQTADRDNPNHERLARNLEVLRSSYSADGENLHIDTIASLPYAKMPDGHMQPAPYLNLAITNGRVLVPSVGDATDVEAAELIGNLFPGRYATLVSSYALTHGGGGPHCITMQWPRA